MKRLQTIPAVLSVLFVGGLVGFSSSPAQVGQMGAGEAPLAVPAAPAPPAVMAAMVDLESGVIQSFLPNVTVMSPCIDSNGDGYYEAVLKLNLDPTSGFTKAYALLDYDAPRGFTLNIGDSATNNGGGGDNGTQQRDAELQIKGNILSVFASDLGGTSLGASKILETRLRLEDGALKVSLADMYLHVGQPGVGLDFSTTPPEAALLYALGGQPDTEGPVNYDIYVGMNCVISGAPGNGRIGSGLTSVYIMLE